MDINLIMHTQDITLHIYYISLSKSEQGNCSSLLQLIHTDSIYYCMHSKQFIPHITQAFKKEYKKLMISNNFNPLGNFFGINTLVVHLQMHDLIGSLAIKAIQNK